MRAEDSARVRRKNSRRGGMPRRPSARRGRPSRSGSEGYAQQLCEAAGSLVAAINACASAGENVVLCGHGDVIPKVVKVQKEERPADVQVFVALDRRGLLGGVDRPHQGPGRHQGRADRAQRQRRQGSHGAAG